jgi:hypothetical protein
VELTTTSTADALQVRSKEANERMRGESSEGEPVKKPTCG